MNLALNLDKKFAPTPLVEIDFSSFQFNGGEVHPKLDDRIDYTDVNKVVITHRIKNSADLMLLILATDAIRRVGVKNVELIIPYVPYARQDRVCVFGEPLSIRVFADIINSQHYDRVICLDPHSDVTTAVINNCVVGNYYQYVNMSINILKTKFNDNNRIVIVSPDAGSEKKITSLVSNLSEPYSVIHCSKKRDVTNGKLSGFDVIDYPLLGDSHLLIVDDICDGGATFIGIYEEIMRYHGVYDIKSVSLYVTHGIFSKGFDELSKCFNMIFCTNSFNDIETSFDNVKQLTIKI